MFISCKSYKRDCHREIRSSSIVSGGHLYEACMVVPFVFLLAGFICFLASQCEPKTGRDDNLYNGHRQRTCIWTARALLVSRYEPEAGPDDNLRSCYR